MDLSTPPSPQVVFFFLLRKLYRMHMWRHDEAHRLHAAHTRTAVMNVQSSAHRRRPLLALFLGSFAAARAPKPITAGASSWCAVITVMCTLCHFVSGFCVLVRAGWKYQCLRIFKPDFKYPFKFRFREHERHCEALVAHTYMYTQKTLRFLVHVFRFLTHRVNSETQLSFIFQLKQFFLSFLNRISKFSLPHLLKLKPIFAVTVETVQYKCIQTCPNFIFHSRHLLCYTAKKKKNYLHSHERLLIFSSGPCSCRLLRLPGLLCCRCARLFIVHVHVHDRVCHQRC